MNIEPSDDDYDTLLNLIVLKPYEQEMRELNALKVLGGWIQHAKQIVINDVNDSRCRCNHWIELCEIAQKDPSIVPTIYESIQRKLGLDGDEWEIVQSFHSDILYNMDASCSPHYQEALTVFPCPTIQKLIQFIETSKAS